MLVKEDWDVVHTPQLQPPVTTVGLILLFKKALVHRLHTGGAIV